MASANKTVEDWFLRGGAKPQPAGSEENEDGVALAVCKNCGGISFAEETECPVCGALLTGGCPTDECCGAHDDGERPVPGKMNFKVRIERTKSVVEVAEVWIAADDCDEAVEIARNMYNGCGRMIPVFSEVEETEDYSDATFEAIS